MDDARIERLTAAIRDVPDFPVKGVIFKDITPILNDPALFTSAVDLFAERHIGGNVDKVAIIDARGFIFGAAVAYRLGIGLVPIRKKDKLPYNTYEEEYQLEYGTAALSVHVDAFTKGENVLLVDDLLATGGTAGAAAKLVERAGGVILEINFLIELTFLNGREKFDGYKIFAPIQI
ncbi:MAG: adenine phosphoribosyltransferase [Verrucomicrobia bacterium]|nr:adenine phosphoribosyltransferase [Verrucomicrobiota bacterium]MDA1086282.1 adenine phosphoribosyltransferase [Verrucomicrobiota bacterium]